MKILTMCDTPPDPNAGAAGTEVRTIEALRALGHEVDSIWRDQLGRRVQHGNLHLLLELPRAYERAMVDAFRTKSYDVVHVNQPHGFRAARTLHRIAPRSVFIHRSHGFEPNVEETLAKWREKDARSPLRRTASTIIAPLLDRHSRAIARFADGHIVSSSSDADYLNERLSVPREKIAVIGQAAPDDFLRSDAPPMTAQRLQRVLYVGQFAFVKAPAIVARAMNRIAEQRSDIGFTWVCDRTHHDDVRSLLSASAKERLELLPWMPQSELHDCYDRCGIFLFPSFYEGFGKAFIEAMSRGLCVIASDTGGMHDTITNGIDGILCAAGDDAAIARAALALASEEARAAAMSIAAARTARTHTWKRVATEAVEFYRSRLDA